MNILRSVEIVIKWKLGAENDGGNGDQVRVRVTSLWKKIIQINKQQLLSKLFLNYVIQLRLYV